MKMNQHQSTTSHSRDTHSISISNDMASSSGSSCASTHPQISISADLKLVIELVGNCNTMIAMNTSSINDIIEKRYEDSIANIKKIDILLSHVKDLEDRLDDIDQQKKTTTEQIIMLDEQAKDIASATKGTSEITDKRLKSLTGRVSSIEHLCVIRSNYNKKRRVSQE